VLLKAKKQKHDCFGHSIRRIPKDGEDIFFFALDIRKERITFQDSHVNSITWKKNILL